MPCLHTAMMYGWWKANAETWLEKLIGGFSENPCDKTNTPNPPGPLSKNSPCKVSQNVYIFYVCK